MSLSGLYDLLFRHRGDGPTGNDPGRQTDGPGHQHKGRAEVSAGTHRVVEKEPVYGVPARRHWDIGGVVLDEGVGVFGLEEYFQGLGFFVRRGSSRCDLERQLTNPGGQVRR